MKICGKFNLSDISTKDEIRTDLERHLRGLHLYVDINRLSEMPNAVVTEQSIGKSELDCDSAVAPCGPLMCGQRCVSFTSGLHRSVCVEDTKSCSL